MMDFQREVSGDLQPINSQKVIKDVESTTLEQAKSFEAILTLQKTLQLLVLANKLYIFAGLCLCLGLIILGLVLTKKKKSF